MWFVCPMPKPPNAIRSNPSGVNVVEVFRSRTFGSRLMRRFSKHGMRLLKQTEQLPMRTNRQASRLLLSHLSHKAVLALALLSRTPSGTSLAVMPKLAAG